MDKVDKIMNSNKIAGSVNSIYRYQLEDLHYIMNTAEWKMQETCGFLQKQRRAMAIRNEHEA